MTGQGDTDTVAEELTTGDGDGLDGDESSAKASGSEFTNVDRGDGSRRTDTEAEYDTTDDDLRDREG